MQTATVQQTNVEKRVTLVVVFWAIAAFLLGHFGFFRLLPQPLFGAVVFLLLMGLIVSYGANKPFRDFCNSIPLKMIALFHTWRIFAGWLFLAYSDVLSPTFVNNAAYGDIIAGFLGLAVFVFGHTKRNYYVFNIVGLLDFVVAVGTGITLTVLGDNGMKPIVELPLIVIPLFGVPLSGFTHYVSLSRLVKMGDKKPSDTIE